MEFDEEHLSNPGEQGFLNGLGQQVYILLCGLPAQRDAEGGIDGLPVNAHGAEHMAPVALGAGGTGGNADAPVLQQVDGILGGQPGNGHIEDVGGLMGTVELHPGQGGEFFTEAVQQLRLSLDVLPEGLPSRLCCGGKAKNRRDYPLMYFTMTEHMILICLQLIFQANIL